MDVQRINCCLSARSSRRNIGITYLNMQMNFTLDLPETATNILGNLCRIDMPHRERTDYTVPDLP